MATKAANKTTQTAGITRSSKRNVRRGAPPVVAGRARRRPKAAAGDIAQTSSAAKGAPATRRTAPKKVDANNTLATYFQEMAALDVLKPEEEFQAARDIESLDILVWQRVLGYPATAGHILSVVESAMENSTAAFRTLRRAADQAKADQTKAGRAKYAKVVRKTAEKLCSLDADRIYSDAAIAEIERLARGDGQVPGRPRLPFSVKCRGFIAYRRSVRQAARGAASARNDFVRANLRLVVSIARRFNYGRMSLADLIQEGNLGLIKAVERYDYRRGFRFSTYASWWIRHAISRALADKGREVRLPVHMIDAYHRISKATRELTAKLGRAPTTEEIAAVATIAAPKIEKMRTYLVDQSFSLDRPVNDEDGRQFIDFLVDPNQEETGVVENLVSEAMTGEVRRVLGELKPIEADILRKRFGFGDDEELTLKQIGEEYNLSRERIRQLQEQALLKMRRAMARRELL